MSKQKESKKKSDKTPASKTPKQKKADKILKKNTKNYESGDDKV